MQGAMYYRICPCKTKVPCTNGLEQIRCPKCGRLVDRAWPRYKMDEPLPDADGALTQPASMDEPMEEDKTVGYETVQRKIQKDPAYATTPLQPLTGRRPGIRRLKGGAASEAEPEAVSETAPEAVPDAENGTTAGRGSQQAGVCLDYYGEKIPVPVGTEVWIGREGLGQRCLEGNLLVSREHVKAHADRAGRLFVEDIKSLNGTWVTKDHVKKRLAYGETAILGKGDILWLYNLPLTIGVGYE